MNTNLENLPTAIIQSGEYATELIYTKNGEEIAIYRAYAYINKV